MPILGIEPAANVAEAARRIGIPTEVVFCDATSGRTLAERYGQADVAVANNVLAHVPDIRGFVAGFATILKPDGVVTFEFPHLLNLIARVQFDTIYHEHFSYLSLLVVERVLQECGLRAFDAESSLTHGGSLRVFACRVDAAHAPHPGLRAVRDLEIRAGLDRVETYASFAPKAAAAMRGLRDFTHRARRSGHRLAAYGAAAKGNTMLNTCGIGCDDVLGVADRSPAKQGKLLPGSHIPVVTPVALMAVRPDDVVILPWNIADEIQAELQPLRERGTRLWVAMPQMLQV